MLIFIFLNFLSLLISQFGTRQRAKPIFSASAILFSTRNIFAVVVIGVSNMAYAHLTYSRYKYRNALLKDMAPYEEEIHKYASAMVEDSRSCVTYAFICVIALYLLVFFR